MASPPVTNDQPGVVVDEREQQRLATADPWPVRDVTDPQVVDRRGLEPSERLRRAAVGTHVQPEPGEVALHGPIRGDLPVSSGQLGDDQLHDVGRGPGRVLALELHREIEQLHITDQLASPCGGDQGVEPASPIGHDPAVQRRAAHRRPLTVRAPVLFGSQLADQLAPLGRGQVRISRFPDQPVTEQRDLAPSRIFHRLLLARRSSKQRSVHPRAREGRGRVAQQPPPGRSGRERPAATDPEPAGGCATGRGDRRDGITETVAGSFDPDQARVEPQRPPHQMRPDHLGDLTEPQQPPTQRRPRHPDHHRDRALPQPHMLELQRLADQRRPIAAADQHRRRQQHVRGVAAATAAPPRPDSCSSPSSADSTFACPPPRTQRCRATRGTDQRSSPKLGLDVDQVRAYRQHRCTTMQPGAPGRPPRRDRGLRTFRTRQPCPDTSSRATSQPPRRPHRHWRPTTPRSS
jgi:hypothetical protein